MTKLEALKDLAAKVEAGEATKYSLFNKYDTTWSGISPHERMASDAYNGSLDAAKALHDAVLGDKHPWSIGEEAGRLQGDPSTWCVGIFSYDADKHIAWECMACPARAWLLAILRALIAQEDAK